MEFRKNQKKSNCIYSQNSNYIIFSMRGVLKYDILRYLNFTEILDNFSDFM